MEAERDISVLLATPAEHWTWILVALIIGLIVGWVSHSFTSRRPGVRR
jgi:uncharacterized membrane-anchored protein YhcB (DUF1043 family)